MTSIRQLIGNLGLPDLNRAQGVDVYGRYQGYFRPETATQRIDFAIQKLTEGITIVDAKREEIWAGVKQIGMRGAYHYQRSGVSWIAQANYFLEYASRYDHHFIALDVETINNTLDNSFASDMYRIVNHWKEQVGSGKKVVLYSNKDLLQNFIFPKIQLLFGDAGVKWLVDEVDIWYAQYFFLPSVNKQPILPSWMKTWKLWQITASAFKGADFGVESQEVDVNVFNGTADEMRAWLGLAEPSDPPEEPPIVIPPAEPELLPETWTGKVISIPRLVVRNYPEVRAETDAGSRLVFDQRVSGRLWAGHGYVWMKLDGNAPQPVQSKWVAVRREGGDQFIRLNPQPEPPTQPPPPTPTGEGYWFALHDWQFAPFKLRDIRPWMNGTPEVFRVGQLENSNNVFEVKLTKEWQFFWFELCSRSVFGKLSKDLSRPERSWLASRWTATGGSRLAFMNHHGLDHRRNYVTGERLNADLPVLYTLICGGMSAAGEVVRNSKGVEMIKLEYFDATKTPPDPASIDLARDPRIFMACNISRKKVPGGYQVFRFPKFSEPARGIFRDCPVPLISTNPVYYPKSRMKWVPGSVKPSPYFP